MKRYFYLIAAIAGLLMAASCQKEDFSVADGDYAEVSFTADLPGVATKAIADGQTVNKLYYEVYAAEDADGNVAAEAQAVVDGTAEISAGNATVNVRLVKNKKYTVFFWAQYEETGYTSPYTWTDLRNITVSYAGAVANDEKRDAFYAVEKAVSFSSAATEKVTLTRPFAQVNVATSDLTTLTAQGITLGNTSISVSDIATSFAPFTGVASSLTNAEFAAAAMADEDLTTNGKTYDYLAMAYVLVPGSADDTSVSTISSTVSFTGLDPITVSYEGATLKQNHRTNIVGNLLTSSVDFEVTVDSDFNDDDNNLPIGPNDLAAKLNAYTSTEAVVYNIVSPSTVAGIDIEIPSTFKAETVTFNFIEIKTGATLTIKDATGGAFNKNVVINLPENVNTSNLTINLPNAHVTLKQGNVTTVISSTSSTTFVVADGVKVESITVNAGNVRIENGAEIESIAVGTDNTATVTVTLEEGAEMPIITGTSGSITVQEETAEGPVDKAQVKVGKITYINNSDEWAETDNLATAISGAAAGSTVTMGVDVTASEIIVIDKNLTLNGNGYSLTSTAGRAINIESADVVTIQNITIDASERAINIINKPATVNVNNVTATATNNAIMIATSAGAVKLTVQDSDLTGLAVINVSGAGADVKISNTKITNIDANDNEIYGAITVWSTAENSKVSVSECSITVADDSKEAYVFPGTAVVTGVKNVGYIRAMIGDGGYESLAEAIKAAKDGAEIILIRDAELTGPADTSKNVTLDLNNKIITANYNDDYALIFEGNLTIKNGTIKTNCRYPFIATSPSSQSTVTITNMKIEATRTENNGAVFLLGWADVTFGSDVEINAKGYGTVIEGSTDSSDGSSKNAVVNINGAKINITSTYSTGTALGSGYGSIINFNSGTIDASNAPYAAYAYPTGGTINIKGGTIIGNFCEHTPYAGKSTEIVITGGSYSENPTNYLANGYTATQSEGYYVVSQQTPQE